MTKRKKMAFDPITAIAELSGTATSLITTVINKIWPDPADREKAEVAALTASVDAAMRLVSAQTAVIVSEAQGGGTLQRNWRPITMLTFLALIVADFCGFRAPDMSAEVEMKLFSLLELGIGGYIIGRSAEKILPQVAEVFSNRNRR